MMSISADKKNVFILFIFRKDVIFMKLKINNNIMDTSAFIISGYGIISPTVVLRNVLLSYETDVDGKRTDKVVAVRYECVDTETFSAFTVKVNGSKPVITSQELDASENLVLLELPVDEVEIRPYSIEYGKVKVSILAPYVKVQRN